MTIIDERRQTARVNMIFPATMDHWNGSLPDVLTMDVSVNGCQVTLPEYCYPGEVVFLNLQLRSQGSLQIRSVVTRCEEFHGLGRYNAGLRFFQPHHPLMDYVKSQW